MIKAFLYLKFSLAFQLENEEYTDYFLCYNTLYQPNLMLLCFVLHSKIKTQRLEKKMRIVFLVEYEKEQRGE